MKQKILQQLQQNPGFALLEAWMKKGKGNLEDRCLKHGANQNEDGIKS